MDLTYPTSLDLEGGARNVCVNTYQYLTLDPNSFVGFDIILGDAFLRNVYASYVLSPILLSHPDIVSVQI